MAKIQGVYSLRAQLYNKAETLADGGGILYEFTDNDRNVSVGSAFNCQLNFTQNDSFSTDNYNDLRKFLSKNKLLIKRARILTPGAAELQPSPGKHAGILLLASHADDGNGGTVYGNAMQLKINHFNEWQDFNIWFENFDIASGDGTYKFYMPSARWALHVDDYNLQSPYKGEPLYAFLELEIDTAGLISGSNRLV